LQKAETLNQNGRVYPKNILEREVRNYQKLIAENRALGECDHPDSSVVELKNVSHIIREAYMEGDSLSDISKRIYRSVNFVKNVINKVGVPRRVTLEEAANIEYLPEECVSEDFVAGEIAWSAKYHTSCEVMAKLEDSKYYDKYNTHCYKIWLREHSELRDSGGFFAYVPGYDLGKLSHLEEYGVNVKSI